MNYEKDKLASRLVYQGMEMVVCEEKCQEKCPYTLVQEHLSYYLVIMPHLFSLEKHRTITVILVEFQHDTVG